MSASEREPCQCAECFQAGVHTRPQLRNRHGEPVHGYELKRIWDARDEFWRLAEERFGPRPKAAASNAKQD